MGLSYVFMIRPLKTPLFPFQLRSPSRLPSPLVRDPRVAPVAPRRRQKGKGSQNHQRGRQGQWKVNIITKSKYLQ